MLSKDQSTISIAVTALISSAVTYCISNHSSFSRSQNTQNDNKNDDESAILKAKNVHEIITTRRTISSFEPTLPSNWETIVKQAIEAAITAPNHKRTEPWRFYVPNRETIVRICELNASIVAEGKGGTKAGEAKLKKWLKVPGWIIVTCVKNKNSIEANGGEKEGDVNNNESSSNTTITMEDPKGRDREDYAAVCCACQNMCLSLHSNGFGTKWSTGKVNFDPRFDEIVGIPTESEYVVGSFWFGIPTKIPSRKEMKYKIDDILSIS